MISINLYFRKDIIPFCIDSIKYIVHQVSEEKMHRLRQRLCAI